MHHRPEQKAFVTVCLVWLMDEHARRVVTVHGTLIPLLFFSGFWFIVHGCSWFRVQGSMNAQAETL